MDDRARGIDVSHWQRRVDWAQVRQAGYSFAGAKASEGRTYNDDMFATHQHGIRNGGFLLGIWYHFAKFGRPTIEADHLLAVVGHLANNERLMLDLEGDARAPAELIDYAEGFADRIFAATGREVMVYTSDRWWRTCGDPASSRLARCPLVVPRYRRLDLGPGDLPRPWRDAGKDWAIWQHSNGTSPVMSVPGAGAVDCNVFNGDEEQLAAFAGRMC